MSEPFNDSGEDTPTLKLHKVMLSIEVPVLAVAATTEQLSDRAWLEHHRGDLFNGLELDEIPLERIQISGVSQLVSVDQIPNPLLGSIPFDHPDSPQTSDSDAEDYL